MKNLDFNKIKVLAMKIKAWEYHAGESFTDYYMHDGVKAVSWGFWLLGKGFIERANEILEIVDVKKHPDQDLMFHIYSDLVEYDYKNQEIWQTEYEKDILLWAEFLYSTDIYTKRVTEFFQSEEYKDWSDHYDLSNPIVEIFYV